jgi:hydrogenase maturation protein HypF
MTERTDKILVLGLGNDLLGDDAVGLRVVRALRSRRPARQAHGSASSQTGTGTGQGVAGIGDEKGAEDGLAEADYLEAAAGGMVLLDLMAGYSTLILIDAIQTTNGRPGRIHRLTEDQLPAAAHPDRSARWSAHHLGLGEILETGRAVGDALPDTVIVYAVETPPPRQWGQGCSPEVERAISKVVGLVAEEIRSAADGSSGEDQILIGAVITLSGVVQGVGFRPFVHRLARECGLSGTVRNFSGGVDIRVEGPNDQVERFYRRIFREAPPLARITDQRRRTAPVHGFTDFTVEQSFQEEERFVLVPPDIAICDNCLAELMDPSDRRHRYPFINCTDCGPRFTIIRDMPYDRPMTTMADFVMCRRCREEYGDIEHRRYHTQPNACQECGPHLFLHQDGQAEVHGERAIRETLVHLNNGKIVAVRGLGGFHLCCDAGNTQAVEELRRRKQRPAKPLAVMMANLETVRACCYLSPEEGEELNSPQRPIVVLRRRTQARISPAVAPGNDTLGVMLPYAPVHHLLLSGDLRALVATSANHSDQPLICDNGEAMDKLSAIADAFLLHNREIHTRCDDSIVRIMDQQPVLLRRARGYAPMPVGLPLDGPPVLACGPELKNTFCLTREDQAFLSQHIGDLKNLETFQFYRQMIGRFEQLFRIRPEVVAHDLHPQYLSTRYARRRSEGSAENNIRREAGPTERDARSVDGSMPSLQTVAVQHHHAHVAACLADNGVEEGAVIGVVFDGMGYGADGHIWGAEFLVADYGGFRRRGQLKYMPLPGGDVANRQPWRMALSYLYDLYGKEAASRARRLFQNGEQPLNGADGLLRENDKILTAVVRMREQGVNSPLASSMGRLFDAVSSLVGLCQENTYEGQAAVRLEVAARGASNRVSGYPWKLTEQDGRLIADPGPMITDILDDLARGRPKAEIARRFHRSVVDLVVRCCRWIRQKEGLNQVALTGGSFQNAILAEETVHRLRRGGFQVLTHRRVPPNDGGLALGQAAVALFHQGGRASCV